MRCALYRTRAIPPTWRNCCDDGCRPVSAFRKGSAIYNAATVKTISAIACAILPLFLAAYSGLAANHEMLISVEDMGIVVSFLIGAIGAVSTVITSPKVGMPELEKGRIE